MPFLKRGFLDCFFCWIDDLAVDRAVLHDWLISWQGDLDVVQGTSSSR